MVEIEYLPAKKIIIHEIIKNSYHEFMRGFAFPGNQIKTRWIDGVLFYITAAPKTSDVVKDSLQGLIHWDLLNFTKMKTFEEKVIDKNLEYELNVINNSSNSDVSDVIKWLKEQSIWED